MVDKSKGIVKKVEKRPVGRPTRYTEELGTEVCGMLAQGETIRGLRKHFPRLERSVVWDWLQKYPKFRRQYAMALSERVEERFDQLEEIAADMNIEPAHKRIMVDARKWVLSKENPAKYGDKVNIAGQINHNHEHNINVTENMKTILNRAGVETSDKNITDV